MKHYLHSHRAGALLLGVALSVFGIAERALANFDLEVEVVASADPVFVGEGFYYTITAINHGPDLAENVVVTDRLSTYAAYIGGSSDVATISEQDGLVTANLGTLNPGERAIILIYARAIVDQTLENAVTIYPIEGDDVKFNNGESIFTEAVPGSNQNPTLTILQPAVGKQFAPCSDVAIAASASDQDGFVAKVEFYIDNQKLGEVSSIPYSFVWTNALPGNHTLKAIAYDDAGAPSVPAEMTLIVKDVPANALFAPQWSPGIFRVCFAAEVGVTYELQTSSDLQNWSHAAYFTSETAVAELFDRQAGGARTRFYRALKLD